MNSMPKKPYPISYCNVKFYKVCYALTGHVISSSNQPIPTIFGPPCPTNTAIPIKNANLKIKSIKIPTALRQNFSKEKDKSNVVGKYVV